MRRKIFGGFWAAIAIIIGVLSWHYTNLGSKADADTQLNQVNLLLIQQKKYVVSREIESLDSTSQIDLIEAKKVQLDQLVQQEFSLQSKELELQKLKDGNATTLSYLGGIGLYLTIGSIAIAYSLSSEPKKKPIQESGIRLVSGQGIYIPADQEQLSTDLNHEVQKFIKSSRKNKFM